MSAADLVDAAARFEASRIHVARALDPELRATLGEAFAFEELPFVRGRTVVPEGLGDDDLVIAGHPNFLGGFDLPAVPRWIAVTGAWSSLVEGATEEVAMAAPVDPEVARRSLAAVVDLAKQLSQLSGVGVAFPPPSPVLIVLVTVDPAAVAAAMGLGECRALSGYPELPGGLRIAPGPVAPGADLSGYAAALEQAIARIQRLPEA